ncbi:MAG: FtsX-like permease family protein [Lactobacillus sp.]|jgi:putative ABC transport system permease protein|nr:FtsX-like permease family protein [Lactobacillus sp.]
MKTLNKNIRREFSHSLPRFLSVTALLTLGVFVLIGLNVTGSNMRQTAEARYHQENLADAQVTTPLNLNQGDRRTITNLKHVAKAEFGNSTDILLKDSNHALRIESLPQTISKTTLVSGKQPQNAGEIVLNNRLKGQYQIGDQIHLATAKTAGTYNLKQKTYRISGFVKSTEFIKTDNIGNTSAGSGQLYGFGFVKAGAFKANTQNMARLTFNNVSGQAYSAEYEDQITKNVDALQPVLNRRNHQRVQALNKTLTTQITTGTADLQAGRQQVQTAQGQLDTLKQQLGSQGAPTQLAQLNAQQAQIDGQRTQLNRAQAQIDTAKATKAQLTDVNLLIQSRNDFNDGYNQFGEDSQRIDALGKSFPILFFLIAILVSFTTMQRMVEEKRIEMGTLRALGYTKGEVMREVLLYSAGTAVLGTVFGSILGLVLLPKVIFQAYAANFDFSQVQLAWHPWLIVLSLVIALASTALAAWLAARAALKEITAQLMLPKPPSSGSRIFLERIGFIWHHLSFSKKVTARNLFRYKSRMFMTIVGIAGATAILITGFGIRDSLNGIIDHQFKEIVHYDAIAVYNNKATDAQVKRVTDFIANDPHVKKDATAAFSQVYTTNGNTKENIQVLVPKNTTTLKNYIELQDAKTNAKLSLNSQGAIISEKLAKTHHVQKGDYLTVHLADGTTRRVKIKAITKMYVGHYLYMNASYYQQVFHQAPSYNAQLITLTSHGQAQVNQFAADFSRLNASVQVVQAAESKRTVTKILSNLNNLVIVIILSASLLSFVVLYTLTNVNVSERMRELSTLKVLGFYPKEVLMYIYRETNILTGVGIATGLAAGWGFHAYIMSVLPPENTMTAPGVTWANLLISVILTILFSLIVMFMMNRKIQSVDMLEALKSVD